MSEITPQAGASHKLSLVAAILLQKDFSLLWGEGSLGVGMTEHTQVLVVP